MAQTQQRPTELYTFTSPVLLAFPNLFTPRQFTATDKLRYDTKALMRPDHPDFQPINEILGRMKAAYFPDINPQDMHFCLQSGDKLGGIWQGWMVVTARTQFLNKQKLGVVLNGKKIDVPPEPDSAAYEQYFYGGVEALMQIEFVPYDGIPGFSKPGISCRPTAVLSLNRGDLMPEFAGGGARASSIFGSYTGDMSNTDPTVGMAGGII